MSQERRRMVKPITDLFAIIVVGRWSLKLLIIIEPVFLGIPILIPRITGKSVLGSKFKLLLFLHDYK